VRGNGWSFWNRARFVDLIKYLFHVTDGFPNLLYLLLNVFVARHVALLGARAATSPEVAPLRLPGGHYGRGE
jgi:hypothetical protein